MDCWRLFVNADLSARRSGGRRRRCLLLSDCGAVYKLKRASVPAESIFVERSSWQMEVGDLGGLEGCQICYIGASFGVFNPLKSNRLHFAILVYWSNLHFYRSSICEGGLGSRNSVRLSVCLSRVDCDKTKWCTADILIPHERAITLLLWHQQWLVGDAPYRLKSALKVTHPLRETPTSTDFRL